MLEVKPSGSLPENSQPEPVKRAPSISPLIPFWILMGLFAALVLSVSPLFASLSQKDFILPPLAEEPSPQAWEKLEAYDYSITREEFERLLADLFAPSNGMDPYLKYQKNSVTLYSQTGPAAKPCVTIHFAQSWNTAAAIPLLYRSPKEFSRLPKKTGKPLDGLRVAIDPADIGGKWGKTEDRSIFYEGYGRIQEGDINLINARLLRDRLTALGALVKLTHEDNEPVTSEDSEDFQSEAKRRIQRKELLPLSYLQRAKGLPPKSPERVRILSEILLTKTYETRARAWKIVEDFQPDLTIVLQHNATASSASGKLAEINRNVFFVPGAYSPEELKDPRQRYQLLLGVLQRASDTEAAVALAISNAFEKATHFPPVLYGNSASTRIISTSNPYVYARNIAVSREHPAPVVVVEPYFMNETVTLKRLLAGDYEGKRMIAGQSRPSIHREYVDAVLQGLMEVYSPRQQ